MKKTIATIVTTATLAIGSQVPIAPAPVTLQEWQAITAMYNAEIQKMGGVMNIPNFAGDMKQVNDIIRTSPPKNSIDGVERERLMKMTEKRTVLEVILK